MKRSALLLPLSISVIAHASTAQSPEPYPVRVNQPLLRDPGLHGSTPTLVGACDMVSDGRLAIAVRQQIDTTTYTLAGYALTALAMDPDKVQVDGEGNLEAFFTEGYPLGTPGPWGSDFAFPDQLTVSPAAVIEWLPVPADYTPSSPPPSNVNLPSVDDENQNVARFAPFSVALKTLPSGVAPFGENPYPCDAAGSYDLTGGHRRYELWMVAAHYPWQWDAVEEEWFTDKETQPWRLGCRDLTIIVDDTGAAPRIASTSIGDFTEFRIGSTTEPVYGHEQSVTADGRLVLYHSDGGNNMAQSASNGWGKTTYAFNPTPFSATGWAHPESVCSMYYREADVGGPDYDPTLVGPPGEEVFFRDLYPLARYPITDLDGTTYAHGEKIRGPYVWLDKDGAFYLAMHNHASESLGGARCGMYVTGAITQGYVKHIDDAALNPTREGGKMEWPIDGQGTYATRHTARFFTTSPGIRPGPWERVFGDRVPVPTLPASERIPVLPVFSSNTDQYGEVRFEEADGNYLLYLACNESFMQDPVYTSHYDADPNVTPDTSGQVPRCSAVLEKGATFPHELVGGGPALRALTGSATGPGDENVGFKGQAILFPKTGRVTVSGCGSEDGAATVQAFVKVLPGWDAPASMKIVDDPGRLRLVLKRDGSFRGLVTLSGGTVKAVLSSPGWLTEEPDAWDKTAGWRHVALTYDGDVDGQSVLALHIDGEEKVKKVFAASSLMPVTGTRDVIVGPNKSAGGAPVGGPPAPPVLVLDEVAISSVARTAEELHRDAYLPPLEDGFEEWPEELSLPLGLDPYDASWPAGAVPNDDVVALGEELFHSLILSGTGTSGPSWGGVSCATCHVPAEGFAQEGVERAPAFGGGDLDLNTPSLLNAAFGTHKFFDGRAHALEDQPGFTIPGAGEMNLPMAEAVARLNDPANKVHPGGGPPFGSLSWKQLFQFTYGGPATEGRLSEALAMYARTLNSGASPFDQDAVLRQGLPGGADALDPVEKHGRALFFGKARCFSCHSGSALSDGDFHNVLSVDATGPVTGRGGATGRPSEEGALKTPTLRNIHATGPYFHDGHAPDLDAVLEHYNRGGTRADGKPSLGSADRNLRPLLLTPSELAALKSFLLALAGTTPG